jgi:para-nitrobenzyl esterase
VKKITWPRALNNRSLKIPTSDQLCVRGPKVLYCSIVPFAIATISALCLLRAPENPTANLPADDNLIVSTTSGKIRGVSRPSGGAEFLGIPYAKPPIGDLRWHEPLPAKPWRGVREAKAFGAPCAQPVLGDWNKHDSESSDEDCLFLNVITPVWPSKEPLPVMFWIHGGANAGGTASSALYKDGTLVQHGVVLVTINYRLGILGFLAHPELTRESSHHASGNYGLMDQIAALRWVRDNIAKFGGDPENITVFGQSAGAHDTSLLMTSPLSKNLFQRAIVQSGSGVMPPAPSRAEAEQAGVRLATAMKAVTGAGAIKYLRQISHQDLWKRVPLQDPTQPPLFGPVIDGWVMQRSPAEVFALGQASRIPLLTGTTAREFGMPVPPDQVRKMIQVVTGSFASRALSLYGLADDGQGTTDSMYGSVGDQWFADLIFRCPVTTQAAWHTSARNATYEYELEHAIPGQEATGAVHASDLPYVFGFYPKHGNISGNFGETDYKLADLIGTYWTNFARTGNPNGGSLPNWPEFGSSQTFIRFKQDGSVMKLQGLRQTQCDLHREVLKQLMNQR